VEKFLTTQGVVGNTYWWLVHGDSVSVMDVHRLALLLVWICCTSFLKVSSLFKYIHVCDERRNLTPKQVKLCFEYDTHMSYILDGSELALKECKRQFAGRRWNCTFPPRHVGAFLHPPMTLPTREAAFVHAIVTAGTMHTLSRACMESKLDSFCACGQGKAPANLPETHYWRGCSDNLEYGYKFSRTFVDAGEEFTNENLKGVSRVLMNLHNNEAGRRAVSDKSIIQCRCHGVSKNCATQTCHRQLGNFKEVGKRLKSLFSGSIHVKFHEIPRGEEERTEMKLVETNTEYNKYTPKDLIHIKESPSYCERNLDIGAFGTKDRQCKKTQSSLNDCSVLCCGRGHHSKRKLVKEKCGCKFVWCCEVKCKTCEKEKNVHYCK